MQETAVTPVEDGSDTSMRVWERQFTHGIPSAGKTGGRPVRARAVAIHRAVRPSPDTPT